MTCHYIPNFDALIDNKSFFDQPVENKQETYEKPIEMIKMVTIQQKIY